MSGDKHLLADLKGGGRREGRESEGEMYRETEWERGRTREREGGEKRDGGEWESEELRGREGESR